MEIKKFNFTGNGTFFIILLILPYISWEHVSSTSRNIYWSLDLLCSWYEVIEQRSPITFFLVLKLLLSGVLLTSWTFDMSEKFIFIFSTSQIWWFLNLSLHLFFPGALSSVRSNCIASGSERSFPQKPFLSALNFQMLTINPQFDPVLYRRKRNKIKNDVYCSLDYSSRQLFSLSTGWLWVQQ